MSLGIKSLLKQISSSLEFLICMDVGLYLNKFSTTLDTLFHFFGLGDGFLQNRLTFFDGN
jgi:hypothetical protein